MWVCTDCGHFFENPHYWEERHGFDYGPFEKFSGCPKCGEPYVEAHQCDSCGEFITNTYIKTESGERYCENCYTVIDVGDEIL